MDLIVCNGRIATMAPSVPEVEALAVRGGRVAATGSTKDMLALKTAGTRVVDLAGRRALPGFNDAHLHALHMGLFASQCDLLGCTSTAEMAARLRRHIEARKPAPGAWVAGRGWNQELLPGGAFPTRRQLDEVSRQHPLVCFRTCMHIAVVNTAALETLGLTAASPQLPGGMFDVETGIFKEAATHLLTQVLRPANAEAVKPLLREVGRGLARQGITSVHSDDFAVVRRPGDAVQAYTELAREGRLPFRCHQQCLFEDLPQFEAFLREAHPLAGAEGFYTLGPVKLLADGSLGGRTAYLSRPYADEPTTRGLATYTQPELDEWVLAAQRAGVAVAVHCIGDGALDMALESIRKARAAHPAPLRHGIVHCQITTAAQLEALAALGLAVYAQPIFIHADWPLVESRVGGALAATSYAFGSMQRRGIRLGLSTDSPVESPNPLHNIYAAVARRDLKGEPRDGYQPGECLSVHEAVQAYTVGSAWCAGQEAEKGRLAPGYLADMAVLSCDIFAPGLEAEAIRDATVEMTMLNGEVVYAGEGTHD